MKNHLTSRKGSATIMSIFKISHNKSDDEDGCRTLFAQRVGGGAIPIKGDGYLITSELKVPKECSE